MDDLLNIHQKIEETENGKRLLIWFPKEFTEDVIRKAAYKVIEEIKEVIKLSELNK
jgi:hypothetical protein